MSAIAVGQIINLQLSLVSSASLEKSPAQKGPAGRFLGRSARKLNPRPSCGALPGLLKPPFPLASIGDHSGPRHWKREGWCVLEERRCDFGNLTQVEPIEGPNRRTRWLQSRGQE